jgi:hypothetical protein
MGASTIAWHGAAVSLWTGRPWIGCPRRGVEFPLDPLETIDDLAGAPE